MDRPRHMEGRSMNVRWRVMLLVWLAQTMVAWLAPLAVMQGWGGSWEEAWQYLCEPNSFVFALIVGASLAALQSLFLFPVRKPGLKRTGRSVWITLGLAAFAGVALFTALCAVVAEVYVTLLNGPEMMNWDKAVWVMVVIQGFAWVVATPLLVTFSKRERQETALARLSALLFTGTIIEVVAIVPLDVMVRRKHDCYCAAGTFWALAICGGVGLFALGPAIYLPILARRRKRWQGGHCEVCAYDMSGTPNADKCPECGSGWKGTPDAERADGES